MTRLAESHEIYNAAMAWRMADRAYMVAGIAATQAIGDDLSTWHQGSARECVACNAIEAADTAQRTLNEARAHLAALVDTRLGDRF